MHSVSRLCEIIVASVDISALDQSSYWMFHLIMLCMVSLQNITEHYDPECGISSCIYPPWSAYLCNWNSSGKYLWAYVVLLALGGSCISTCMLGSSEEGLIWGVARNLSFLSNYFCTFKKGIPIVTIAVSLMKDSGNRFTLLMATKNTTTMKYMFL